MRTELLTRGTSLPIALLAPVTHETHQVNPKALAGMATVRRFGMADLYDREQVINLVEGLGFRDGADWLRANRHLYFIALRNIGG